MNEFHYYRINQGETDYRRRRKGLGIRDAIKAKTNVTPESDAFGQMFFRAIIAAAPLTKFPPTDALIKKVAMLGGSSNTKGHSVPLHLDATAPAAKASKKVKLEVGKTVVNDMHPGTVPQDMLRDTIRRATYLAVLDECLCRKIQGCKDYPP